MGSIEAGTSSVGAHSPPLPLIIYYPGRLGDASGQDEGDVLFALQHRERVRRIHLRAPATSLPNLINAMNGEYPTLQCLVIRSHAATGTGIQLPAKLQAPLLRRLTLSDVRLPATSELLLRAEDLVTLELLDIADTSALHPSHLVAQLARMTQLERLVVHFRTALPSRAVEHTLWGTHTPRTTLPRLTLLSFRGSSAYLEHTLARLIAPSLQTLFVDLFAQLTFSLPHLARFIHGAFAFHAAELHFDADTVCVMLDRDHSRNGLRNRTNPVQLRVSCRALDWQLAALAQICGALAPLFVRVEGLTLGLHVAHPTPDAERAQWHALLGAFGGTKTLQLAGPRAGHLLRSLLPLPADLLPALQELLPGDDAAEPVDGDGDLRSLLPLPADLLPALQELLPGDDAEPEPEDEDEDAESGDGEGALDAFTGEREAAGCPVRVVRDWW